MKILFKLLRPQLWCIILILLILTGENIKEDDLEAIQKGCPNYVPIHFMPSLKYQENCEDYYFQGLEVKLFKEFNYKKMKILLLYQLFI